MGIVAQHHLGLTVRGFSFNSDRKLSKKGKGPPGKRVLEETPYASHTPRVESEGIKIAVSPRRAES